MFFTHLHNGIWKFVCVSLVDNENEPSRFLHDFAAILDLDLSKDPAPAAVECIVGGIPHAGKAGYWRR